MNRRINIMLPETTLAVIERVTTKGNRSSFISRAVLDYVHSQGKRRLRERLKRGYRAAADDSLKIATEWFPIEEQAWQKAQAGGGGKR